MFGFKNKNMLKIKNRTITSYEELVNQLKLVQNEMAHLQREKDMKVDKIENDYQAKIEQLIRTEDLIKNEMERTKAYISPKKPVTTVTQSSFITPIDTIIPTEQNIERYNGGKNEK